VALSITLLMQRRYDAPVRTTIDLPGDLHEVAKSLAHDRSQTMSETVADLMRSGLGWGEPEPSYRIERDPLTGFPFIDIGTTITTEDVRSLEDDE
jgi:hypothetical protein